MEFKLSSFIVSLLLFCAFIGGLAIVYSGMTADYSTTADLGFNQTYNKIDKLNNVTSSLSSSIQEEDTGDLDVFFLAGKTVISAPKVVIDSFGVVAAMAVNLSEDLGVHPLFIGVFTTIIVLMLVFAAISLWARWDT